MHSQEDSEMTVYVELLFLDNLLMNALTLMLAARMASRRIRMLRTWLAAGLGAGYAFLFFLSPPDSLWGGFVTKVLFAAAMVGLANRPRTWREMGAFFLYFVLATCILGGLTLGLFYLAGAGVIDATGTVVAGVPFRVVLIGAVAGCVILEYVRRDVRVRAHIDLHSVQLTIGTDAGEKTVRALVDTGNGLNEPISGAPVVLVRKSCLKQVAPHNAHTRTVPCMTIGGVKLLRAYRAPYVRVQAKRGEERITEGVYVAEVDEGRLGEGVDAIIGPGL
jgi:stage II sporulation protein GA (sporulation sigma-E factor processing peptidase)